MKYIGNFQNHNLPRLKCPKLFTYIDEMEIIVHYNEGHPFWIEQISILIDNEDRLYAVFECGLDCKTDVQAKNIAKHFAQLLIDLITNYTI